MILESCFNSTIIFLLRFFSFLFFFTISLHPGYYFSLQTWELMNTAVLTGRQVSQVMKVFIVTQAGKVADVTLQSSCHAEDESVIKVKCTCRKTSILFQKIFFSFYVYELYYSCSQEISSISFVVGFLSSQTLFTS